MPYFLVKRYTLLSLTLCFLAQEVNAQDDPVKLDWCFDNINGSHQMLGSPPQPSGPSVELIHYLAEQVGFTVNYIAPTPSLRCLKLLSQGKVDIMTNLTHHSKLTETVNLYKYLDSGYPIKMVVSADEQRNIDSIEMLLALRVALVRGYDYGDTISNLTKTKGFSTILVNSAEAALRMLKKKRVDIVLLPTINALNIENDNQEIHLFKHLDLPSELKPLGAIHVGLSKNSKYAYLGPKIEAALNKAIQSGFINSLVEKSKANKK